ncbi:protein kinase [Streptoverticillium reticulum]|uniref:protein kinase n=1 Tax=Streptoverticillium reticulum TaxID=1433415 RepID=UPI0039BFD73B
MDEYAGRVLAERYRLPLPPSEAFELVETRAFDTYSGQEVLVRQIPLPEVVDAEVVGGEAPYGAGGAAGRTGQGPGDPAVRRALAAATAAAQLPDHPRLDQVFHVFAEAGSLWIVSELVAARPLAAVLAERALSPHRAAEVAADVLTALRALHAHGWTHRNITVRTVLICDDGRAILTGLAAGAAEEALCGYDPVPQAVEPPRAPTGVPGSGTPTAAAKKGARSAAVAAYTAGTRAAAARTPAGEGRTGTATGASTWGGGSAASGTAPAPGSQPPWSADSLVHGVPPARTAPEAVVEPAARAPQGPQARTEPTAARPAEGWAQGAGPGSALAAERARQARMVVVGAVTERWAPEQAWPVQENWQLAPPVGPAADLWALGALLFRVVQGHAPYPEENTAELLQAVCTEPPSYAEECGALRPVVESLMRKDPAERPEFEELRGWLRSLIRSAPEPDIGSRTVTVPSIGALTSGEHALTLGRGAVRLPVVRRRGELVRRRGARTAAAEAAAHGRHKKHLQEQRVPATTRSPHRLGRLLVGAVLLALLGAVLYALLFMPRAERTTDSTATDRTGAAGSVGTVPQGAGTTGRLGQASASGAREDGTTESGDLAQGFSLREDPKGFSVAVAKDWQRIGDNDRGQVVYAGGAYELIVVPGRDKAADAGTDPMAYQADKEPELAPYRSSSWSGASGLRRTDVGGTATAEGTFTWNDSSGRPLYVRNAAMLLKGRYHLLQVIGPADRQRSVDTFFDQASATYRTDG